MGALGSVSVVDYLIQMAGEGADEFIHLEVEKDGGGFGEGE